MHLSGTLWLQSSYKSLSSKSILASQSVSIFLNMAHKLGFVAFLVLLSCWMANAIAPGRLTTTPQLNLDACDLHDEGGTCHAYIRRYHFDITIGKCNPFIYGGCGGNANNFETMKECEAFGRRCVRAKKHRLIRKY